MKSILIDNIRSKIIPENPTTPNAYDIHEVLDIIFDFVEAVQY